MKKLIFILALLPLAVFGQTKNVLKGVSTNALTESLVVPSGKSITIDSGATITNNGTATGFGSGTVTSVALTMPSIFSVAGSPLTTSGTLAASLATQSANLVFAGPTTGSAAAPTFRSLVAADIPDLSATYQPLNAKLTTLATGFGAIYTDPGILQWTGTTYQVLTSAVPVPNGGTGLSTYTLGDLIYASNTTTLAALGGNTATTKKFLAQTGNGSASAAPAWDTISAGDVPTLNQNTTGNAATATALETARTINGTAFDGTANITITAAAETLTGSALPALDGSALTNLNASALASGTVGTARLGTGTADSTTYLRGDNTWQTISSGLTIGTTAITSGTNGRVLYNNSGVVGELTTTGSGSVVLGESPTISGVLSIHSVGGIAQPTTQYDVGVDQAYATTFTSFAGRVCAVGVNLGSSTGNGISMRTTYGYHWSSTADTRASIDTSLTRVSAGIVGATGLRVGANGTAMAQIKRSSVTLVAGTATVSDTDTTANTVVLMSVITPGGTVGHLDYDVSAGSSYTINSDSGTDTSTVNITVIHFP